MQTSNVSLNDIIYNIQNMPHEALLELNNFISFLQYKFDLSKQINKTNTPNLKEELLSIGKYCAALPLLDDRTPEQILGYNDNGMP